MENIPLGQLLSYGSGWAIVGLFVVLMARGQILSRSNHSEIVADKDKRIAAQEATITSLSSQNKLLLDSAIPTINVVFNALHAAAKGEQP